MKTNSTKAYFPLTLLLMALLLFSTTAYNQVLTSGSCIGVTYYNDERGDAATLMAVDYANGNSAWYYEIISAEGINAISHITFELGTCATVIDHGTWSGDVNNINPVSGGVSVEDLENADPTTGVLGFKFDEGFEDSNVRYFYFTLKGAYAIEVGMDIGVKSQNINNIINACGPSLDCELATLPVELTYFSATPESNAVRLEWETETESNNDFFQVEHSWDGHDFTTLSKVDGAGDSRQPLFYSYVHKSPPAGTNYYRLKQVDFDGAYEYSDAVTVKVGGKGAILLYPNPAKDRVWIQHSSGEELNYALFDVFGRMLQEGIIASQQEEIGLSQLPEGFYQLRLANRLGEVLSWERLQKVR